MALLAYQLPNLKKLSFTINKPMGEGWYPCCIIDDEEKYIKTILDLIYFLIDHLQQLVWLKICFPRSNLNHTPVF
jgi:hypothetical protein